MFEVVLSLSMVLVLLWMSAEDYRNHSVRINLLLLLWVVSLCYAVMSWSGWLSLASLVYLVLFFGPLLFFRMGAGDLVVLVDLWPFLAPLDHLWLFVGVFMVVWLLCVLVIYCKDKKKMGLRIFLFKRSIPLIPVITVAFIIFLLL